MSLGAQLRQARLQAGLTQEELSFRAAVDRSYVSQLERDLKSPTVDMLLRLCRALDTSAARIAAAAEPGQGAAAGRATFPPLRSPADDRLNPAPSRGTT